MVDRKIKSRSFSSPRSTSSNNGIAESPTTSLDGCGSPRVLDVCVNIQLSHSHIYEQDMDISRHRRRGRCVLFTSIEFSNGVCVGVVTLASQDRTKLITKIHQVPGEQLLNPSSHLRFGSRRIQVSR